jgi:small-conductance mechanosensitive channel
MAKVDGYQFQLQKLQNTRKMLEQRLNRFQELKEVVLSDNERLVKSAENLKQTMNEMNDQIAFVRSSRGSKGDTKQISTFERTLNFIKRQVGPNIDIVLVNSKKE